MKHSFSLYTQTMNRKKQKVFCIVPAAGIGLRMQATVPKQYLPLQNETVLDATLGRLLSNHLLVNVIVCIAENDHWWQQSTYANNTRVLQVAGGKERADSVLNGIQLALSHAELDDWVMVHDAARPCLRQSDIDLLISKAVDHQQGAILATPIHDTVKYVDNKRSFKTLDRSRLWRALTPQIFKLGELHKALIHAIDKQLIVTDEASAIEAFGLPVQVIEGHADNIKVTQPDDLALAEFFLNKQKGKSCE